MGNTEADVLRYVAQLFGEAGGSPSEILGVTPVGGDWNDATAYDVTAPSGGSVRIMRTWIDRRDEEQSRPA